MITDAWVRVRPRPEWKAAATVRFERFGDACEAVREIVQAGLDPANCRLLEAAEAEMTGAGDGSSHLLLLAFESAHHPVDAPLAIALAAAKDHGGTADEPRVTEPAPVDGPKTQGGLEFSAHQRGGARKGDGSAAESGGGRSCLAPYLRDTFVACGVLSETFETAITWDRLEEFHATVMETTRRAVAEVTRERRARAAGRRSSPAASPTPIPTASRLTSPSWPRRSAAARSSSGTRSRPPSPRR